MFAGKAASIAEAKGPRPRSVSTSSAFPRLSSLPRLAVDAAGTKSGWNWRRGLPPGRHLLMLDEVNAGLNATEIDGALETDQGDCRARALPFLLIETLDEGL